MRTGSILWTAIAAVSILSMPSAGADHDWPKAWFEAAKTASEVGIDSFSQSPMLDNRDLPPVEKRLPDDPVVIVPLETIGQYGGKARITLGDSWQFFNWEAALTISADLRTLLAQSRQFLVRQRGWSRYHHQPTPGYKMVRRRTFEQRRFSVLLQPSVAGCRVFTGHVTAGTWRKDRQN